MADGGAKWIPLVAAALLLMIFGWGTYWMFQTAGNTSDAGRLAWEQRLLIYNGLSSLGFAAAGLLLGVRVERTSLLDTRAAMNDERRALVVEGDATAKEAQRIVKNARLASSLIARAEASAAAKGATTVQSDLQAARVALDAVLL